MWGCSMLMLVLGKVTCGPIAPVAALPFLLARCMAGACVSPWRQEEAIIYLPVALECYLVMVLVGGHGWFLKAALTERREGGFYWQG